VEALTATRNVIWGDKLNCKSTETGTAMERERGMKYELNAIPGGGMSELEGYYKRPKLNR